MRRSFSYGQLSIPTVSIDETQIYGSGGAYAPVLNLLIRLDGRVAAFKPHEGIRFLRMRGILNLSNGEEIVSRDAPVNLLVNATYSSPDHLVYLEFPIDTGRISLLEKYRSGGDLKLRLKLRLETEQLHAVAEIPSQHLKAFAWAHVQHHEQTMDEDITFPHSTWIKRVLPQVGYGKIHLIELPAVPIEETEQIGHAFAALKQAQEHHRNGLYDDAVLKCRIALDQFFETVDGLDGEGKPKRVRRFKASWEMKLGAATATWLKDSLGSVKDVVNKAAHSPERSCDQFTSQMIQAIVTTLISYAARQADDQTSKA